MKSQIQIKIDSLQDKTSSLEESLNEVIESSSGIDSRVTVLESSTDSLESRVSSLEEEPKISVSVPLGSIIAFSGSFGGTSNRFPIPLGSTEPDTSWCLCDGITTNGLTVPDLRGRMILASSDDYPAGTSGGSDTLELTGEIGNTTLSANQLAAHSHYVLGSGQSGYDSVSFTANETGSGYWIPSQSVGGSESHTHSISLSVHDDAFLPPYYSLSYIMRCAS